MLALNGLIKRAFGVCVYGAEAPFTACAVKCVEKLEGSDLENSNLNSDRASGAGSSGAHAGIDQGGPLRRAAAERSLTTDSHDDHRKQTNRKPSDSGDQSQLSGTRKRLQTRWQTQKKTKITKFA